MYILYNFKRAKTLAKFIILPNGFVVYLKIVGNKEKMNIYVNR